MQTILKNKLRIGGVISCFILVVLLIGLGHSTGKGTPPPISPPESRLSLA